MKRILLNNQATRQNVEAALRGAGWALVESPNPASQVIAYKSSWLDGSKQQVANYIENRPLSCAYVFANDAAYDAMSRLLTEASLLLSRDEVLATALTESGDAEALRTIGRLGLLAHGAFDKTVFSKLAALLIHRHPMWQRFALYALSNTSWSAFAAVLNEAIEGGVFDADVKPGAEAMLRDLEASNWNAALYSED